MLENNGHLVSLDVLLCPEKPGDAHRLLGEVEDGRVVE